MSQKNQLPTNNYELLKNTIKNSHCNKSMDYVIRETYLITHRKLLTNTQQIYIGATSTY